MKVYNAMEHITVQAPAKINLYLRVISRRPDGYHEIESLMQKVDLCDTLHLSRRRQGISLSCPGTDLPCDASNLAYRAARSFLGNMPQSVGVDIVLEKRIPVAAGLGGGSSDAAAVLIGLNKLLGGGLTDRQLMELARPLGADVPFFVGDFSAAWATGIGECLEACMPLSGYWLVLVNPGFAVSTKWVYQNFALTTHGNPFILGRVQPGAKKISLPHPGKDISLYNDLESVTIKRYPEINTLKRKLIDMGALDSLMSGSGPTVFAVFDDKRAAVDCLQQLQDTNDIKVYLTEPYQVQ